MKISKSYYPKVIWLVIAVIFFSACKRLVEVPAPTQSLVTANVFDKNTTATAAQLAIYAQMQDYQHGFNVRTGLSADEYKTYSSAPTTVNLYQNALNEANDSGSLQLWEPGYSLIYQCNAIVKGLAASGTVSNSVKKQLTGEAKFIRAYVYFHLIGVYGDVPLVLTTDYAANTNLLRTRGSTVLQQIIVDLKDAQNLLNDKYVDATDTVATSARIRPNKWAATALLARAYLYTANSWPEAEAQASAVLSNTAIYSLPTDLNTVFLIASTEAIWQLQPNAVNKYTAEGSGLILTGDVTTSANSSVPIISAQLLSAFETGDKRRTFWINSLTAASGTYQYAYKYKAGRAASTLTEYSMMLRLAEQYLIRAEARAKQNKLTDAIADINVIRLRAGLPILANTLSQEQVLAAVYQERQVELFTEGHRWLDLKRTGVIDAVMSVVAPLKGGTWLSYKQLFPIPFNDVNNSAGRVIQNPGY